MSIRKVISPKGKTVWEVRYRLDGRGSKRICKRFRKASDAEAFQKTKIIERDRLTGQTFSEPKDHSPLSFHEAADTWLRLNAHRFTSSHLKNVELFIKRIVPEWGHVHLERMQPTELSKIQADLLKQGLKPSSVNRHLQMVLAVLNWALRERRITFNPAAGFRKLREPRNGVSFWEQNEVESFLAFANRRYPREDPLRWIYVVYLVAVNTGARAGEIWGLKPSDIEPNGEVLLIQRQLNKVLGDFAHTKGKSERRVPCNPALLKELKTLIKKNQVKSDETIFINGNREPVNHDNFVKRIFVKDVKAWGGRKIRFHDLRHTSTTLMIASGVDLKTVQEICGHENIKTTMNYTHLLSERIRETARSFSILPTLKSEPKAARIH